MTETKLKNLVTQAVGLDREIARATEELKSIKQLLAAEAESRTDDRIPTDGGGWSLVLDGVDGCIARVTKSGPKLKSSINTESKTGIKIMELVGKWKQELFIPAIQYTLIDNFRDAVKNLFDRPEAHRIIKACETPGSTTVSFETKEKAEAA